MKIAVVCAKAPEPRETFLRRDIAALRTRYDVRVFGLARRMPVVRLLPLLHNRPPREAVSLSFRLRTAAEIAEYVADGGAIFAHFAWTTADVAATASQLSGRPWFCFVHAWDVFTRPAAELRRRTETAARIVACSQAAANACVAAGIDHDKISVIHHAVFQVESQKSKVKSLRPPAAIAVGRLVEKKGFDTLVRAWPAVLRAVPGATLRIVGDGPCAASLRRLAREVCGDNRSISFAGNLPEMDTLNAITAADMLVLPSRRLPDGDRDGIANVILEAMATGVPVVTTDAGAAGEVVKDGLSGLLLPHPATPETLSAAILRLAGDERLRATLAGNARTIIRDGFSPEAYLAAVEALID